MIMNDQIQLTLTTGIKQKEMGNFIYSIPQMYLTQTFLNL